MFQNIMFFYNRILYKQFHESLKHNIQKALQEVDCFNQIKINLTKDIICQIVTTDRENIIMQY